MLVHTVKIDHSLLSQVFSSMLLALLTPLSYEPPPAAPGTIAAAQAASVPINARKAALLVKLLAPCKLFHATLCIYELNIK
jgi:hypothetical protein